MEMMVTKDSQTHLKRNKIDKSIYEEQDQISLLPDCLLIDIISRLPTTKEAITTGTLSKRWQHLWPFVSNLIFIDYYPVDKFVSLVDKTITQCRQSNLHKFKIRTSYDVQYKSNLNNWIRYAFDRNVEDLDITLFKITTPDLELDLDQFVFTNPCLTHLKLQCCEINPTGAICWTKLKSLSISRTEYLTEDLIQNILSGSPLLETLELRDCSGFGRIDVTSKSVKNLMFSGYMNPDDDSEDIIEINAPYITSLIIADSLWLYNLLLVDVSSLVMAHLDYKKQGHYEPTREVVHEETLKGLILSLRHVQELKLGIHCAKVLSFMEAKGFIAPWNLNVVDVASPLSFDADSSSLQREYTSTSDRDSNESGDYEEIVEQVLGTSHGHNHGPGRKLVGVASTTCAQSEEPIYTQSQVDAMFEAQNKMITTQHEMIKAQSSQFSTLVRALIKSGFSVPASIVPENVNEENEEEDVEDNNDK